MSENCNHNCSECASDCDSRMNPEDFIEKPHELASIKKVYAVMSGKGGVGKSIVTSLLASTVQKNGLQAAILDADVTGPSIPRMFGVHELAKSNEAGLFPSYSRGGVQMMSVNLLLENETDPVVWRGPMITGIVRQFWTDVMWKDVDAMFVDMPPGTGDVPLTVFQTLPIDGVIIVTSPQELVEMIVSKAIKMTQKMNIPVIGLVENMAYFVCPSCGEKHMIYGDSNIAGQAEKYSIANTARIPLDPAIASASDKGGIEDIQASYLKDIADSISRI